MDMEEGEPCEEELKIMEEIKEMKKKIKEKRKEAADEDYVTATENIPQLGRLKFKIRKQLHGHLAKITDLHWGEDSQAICTAGQDGKLFVWDTYSTTKTHAVFLKTAWVMCCSFNPRNDHIASGGLDNLLSIFKMSDTDADPVELTGHNGYIAAVRYIDDSHIITSSGDKTCALWDLETGKIIHLFEGHRNDVNALALANHCNHFVSASSDETAKLWDLREKNCQLTFEGHESDINGVDYFPNNDYAFGTASEDGSCRLWDIRSDHGLANFSDEYIQCGSTRLAITKSGRLLIAGYDDYNCHVWDILLEERVGIMLGHDNRISCLGISPNGLAVATGAWDNNCFIWTAK